MCGITGLIDFRKSSSEQELKNMTSVIAHRGPDGDGMEIFQHDQAIIGFGHRRLAILDLSEHGKQTMQFEHLWLCFNGEVYNFREIKEELSALGHSFKGDSDSEMILHAYLEWGDKCLDRFIGMFAFAIFDSKKERVFCARDRAGVKPFFYYWHDGLFLFSSELKSFHEHNSFQKEIDKDAVAAFLQYWKRADATLPFSSIVGRSTRVTPLKSPFPNRRLRRPSIGMFTMHTINQSWTSPMPMH